MIFNYLRQLALYTLIVIMTAGFLFYGGSVVWAADSSDAVAPTTPGNLCDSVSKLGDSTYCTEQSKAKNGSLIGRGSILSRMISIVIMLTGAVSVVMIVYGGFRYVISGGDQQAVKSAKDTILYAVIGLVVAMFAQAIVVFVVDRL